MENPSSRSSCPRFFLYGRGWGADSEILSSNPFRVIFIQLFSKSCFFLDQSKSSYFSYMTGMLKWWRHKLGWSCIHKLVEPFCFLFSRKIVQDQPDTRKTSIFLYFSVCRASIGVYKYQSVPECPISKYEKLWLKKFKYDFHSNGSTMVIKALVLRGQPGLFLPFK